MAESPTGTRGGMLIRVIRSPSEPGGEEWRVVLPPASGEEEEGETRGLVSEAHAGDRARHTENNT